MLLSVSTMGGEYTQLLVTGGLGGGYKMFGDCWILDVDLERWRDQVRFE